MNRAILIGNLTRDPDLRTTNSGISVCTFTVAVQRRFQNQNGEREADFIPVVCWRQLAETCGKYLAKGRKVGVSGHIQTRNYEANDGSRRTMTEVVADEVEFLTSRGQSSDGERIPLPDEPAAPSPFGGGGGNDNSSNNDFGEMIDDSELPF